MNAVVSTEGTWRSARSKKQIHYILWHPPVAARALLVLIHGFAEYAGRYQQAASRLAQRGIWVAAADLPGHGRSSGSRGDVGSVEACIEDLESLTESVFIPSSGQNHFSVYGHSFGGLLAIAWMLKNPPLLKRAAIQSPLLETGFPIPAWKKMAAKWLNILCPTCSLAMDLDPAWLSQDLRVGEAYRRDPLVHNKMSARSYHSILETRDRVNAQAGNCQTPTLLLYGAADKIISTSMARQWFDRLRCEKRCVVCPDCRHELHNEPVLPDVIREIADWTLKGCA